MQSKNLPTLKSGEIVVHDASRTIGQVVETICPPDDNLAGFEQVLLLLDGTRHNFRMTELRPASQVETRRYVLAAVGC